MNGKLAVAAAALGCVLVLSVDPLLAGKDRFVDTDEYKEKSFDKGIIEDYSDMVEGDGVEWVYLAPGVKLSKYKIEISEFSNKSDVKSSKMVDAVQDSLQRSVEKISRKGGSAGTLKTENAVYWAERSSQGKKWIPYAGGHLAQAGVGIEMVFKTSDGKIVAKIRHSGRQGDDLDDAAGEVADEVGGFIEDH